MAAQRAVVLENHTKLFVEAKVGERIKMEFTTGQVQIKPENKHGSTTLGAFWVRVVQAYFPKEEFTYTKRYCSKYGTESLSVSSSKKLFVGKECDEILTWRCNVNKDGVLYDSVGGDWEGGSPTSDIQRSTTHISKLSKLS